MRAPSRAARLKRGEPRALRGAQPSSKAQELARGLAEERVATRLLQAASCASPRRSAASGSVWELRLRRPHRAPEPALAPLRPEVPVRPPHPSPPAQRLRRGPPRTEAAESERARRRDPRNRVEIHRDHTPRAIDGAGRGNVPFALERDDLFLPLGNLEGSAASSCAMSRWLFPHRLERRECPPSS